MYIPQIVVVMLVVLKIVVMLLGHVLQVLHDVAVKYLYFNAFIYR